MKNNKKLQFFDNLQTSENLKQKILNQTINNDEFDSNVRIKKMPKLAYGFCVLILVSFISCAVVFAATYIHSYVLNIRKDDEGNYHQTLVVKETISIKDVDNFSCGKNNSLKEIGDTLGIQFVNNTKYNNLIDNCDVQINKDGKIESMSLYVYEYVDFSKENNKIDEYDSNIDNAIGYFKGKHIGLTISFMTQNASDEVKEKFTNLNEVVTSQEMEVKEIKLTNLNVIAHSYRPIRSERNRFFTYVVFVHNNIVYTFSGYRVSVEDIINVIQE